MAEVRSKKSKVVSPVKIHLAKYFAKNSISLDLQAFLRAKNGSEMRTEEEWGKVIKKQLSMRL